MIHKQVDFEVPGFGEVPGTYTGDTPAAALTTDATAGFPDRPAGGGAGLRATLATGEGAATVHHDVPEGSPLHARVMLGPATASGTRIAFLGVADASGSPLVEVAWRPGDGRIEAGALSADVPVGLAWHCVELGLDAPTGTMSLQVNGVLCGETSGLTLAAPGRVLLGVCSKSADAAGALHLDEWVLADAPIGPVVAPPRSPHADDPARWLVIYNRATPDADRWAEAYRAARGVPYANLCGLALPTTPGITLGQYLDLADQVQAYLAGSGLSERVIGLLAGYGVPGEVVVQPGEVLAVSSLLTQCRADALPSPSPIALATQRPTRGTLAGSYLVARLDGPTVADAIALIDRAAAIEDDGLGDGADAAVLLDTDTDGDWVPVGHAEATADWLASIEGQRLRLPVEHAPPGGFASISHDGFYGGWRSGSPPSDFFGQPAGRRIALVQIHPEQAPATDVRDPAGTSWPATALRAGYAAALGAASGAMTANALPRVWVLLDRLRRGWTLAEALAVSVLDTRTPIGLVGDPLLRIAVPAAGWEVLGPAASGEALEPALPAAVRRAAQASADVPAAGDREVWGVRYLDAAGRASAPALIATQQGSPAMTLPAWPLQPGWPVRVAADAIEAVLIWDRPIQRTGVVTAALLAQPATGPEHVVASASAPGHASHLVLRASLPTGRVQYRFRLTDAAGNTWNSPPSRPLMPVAVATHALHIAEVTP